MGCINVSVSRLGGVSAVVGSEGGIGVGVSPISGIAASADRVGGIGLQADRRGGIEFSVSLVCVIGAGRYLRVKPQEPLWIDVGAPDAWTVTSNVAWTLT